MKPSALLRIAILLCVFLGSAAAIAKDASSYANDDAVRVRSLHLDLKAEFAQRSLSGFAELTLNWIDPKALTVELDTRDLAIARVHYQDAQQRWIDAPFMLDKPDPQLGQALRISLPVQAARLRIYYRTSPGASALQWMAPAQTMSGKWSFLYSQSKPTHARSWIPLQDTANVRFTYTARIDAPAGLRVVMGGESDAQANGQGGWRFAMPHPVPSYLLAIAIGELEQRSLGPRTAVYAEPQRMAAAAFELADTEKMVEAAEALYGPYRWQRFDMLVLPAVFPAGGAENARIAFLNASMLSGDRSLVSLVAHQLAHSWSGNQPAHAAYVANRIIESVYGADAASMQRQLDQEEPDVEGSKDAWLLHAVERRVGRASFDPFLRNWFDRQAFKNPTPAQFADVLRGKLTAQNSPAATDEELTAWTQGGPMPASAMLETPERMQRLDVERINWLQGVMPTARLASTGWSALEWMKFLNDIDGKANAAQLADLDKNFGLSTTSNQEIAFRFHRAAIRAGYTGARPALTKFLMGVGRLKFVEPLYALLLAQPQEKAWVRTLYASRARPMYHPQTQAAVDKLLRAMP